MKLGKYYLNLNRMNFLFKIVLIFIFILSINASNANTLFDSLNLAYLNNPKLNAERANITVNTILKKYFIFMI